MPKMPPGGENASSRKGASRAKGHGSESVAQIEGEHDHAGERGMHDGVVFKLPSDGECTDHSRVRELD